MRINLQHSRLAIGLLLVGFLFLFLEGCTTPLIEVKVDANAKVCEPGAEGSGDRDVKKTGPCDFNIPFPNGDPDTLSGVHTFWHQDEDRDVTAADNLTCDGEFQERCRFAGSNCGGGKKCRNTYFGEGNCSCFCGET